MKLPIAVQTALEESERQMAGLLDRMALDRPGLDRIAEHVRIRSRAERVGGPGGEQTRRGGIHV